MTHLLRLLDKMYKYQIDPTRTVGTTERARDAGRTDGQMDGQTDGVKPITSLYNDLIHWHMASQNLVKLLDGTRPLPATICNYYQCRPAIFTPGLFHINAQDIKHQNGSENYSFHTQLAVNITVNKFNILWVRYQYSRDHVTIVWSLWHHQQLIVT